MQRYISIILKVKMRDTFARGLWFAIPAFLILSFGMMSCNTTKKIKYFQDIPDSGVVKNISKAQYKPLIIRPGDIMTVVIETIDPSASNLVNSGNLVSGGVSSSGISGLIAAGAGGNQLQQPISGFLVGRDGFIEMPIIGKIEAAGFTSSQLRDSVYKVALKYYKDPTVIVRFANFKVDVMGEVLKPGQYIMPDEKESILDAISMAGDLTIFGKRENVLLVRQHLDGTKTAYRIDLKKSDILSSPEYYLRQNDIIYVEPRKAKSDANDAAQAKYISIASSVLGLLIIIATRIK